MLALTGKAPKICVIGSINMDLVVRTPRFAEPGETLSAHEWKSIPGGKGANQAVAASRLGASTQFCGRIGCDAFGEELRCHLINEQIDVSHLRDRQDVSTGVALIAVDDKGRNAIYVVGGANHTLTPSDISEFQSAVKHSAFLLLQLEIPIEATLAAIELAKSHGIPVLLDPAPAPHVAFPESLLQVELLSPNEFEAELLTGLHLTDLENGKRAAIDLQRRGAKEVVIKLGSRGAITLCNEGRIHHVEAAEVRVIDSTAAGDAFTAALAYARSRGESLVRATQFACAAGGRAVQKAGAQPSMPTFEETAALLEQHEFRARML